MTTSAARRAAGFVAAVAVVGLTSRPADACEPVKTPLRVDDAAVVIVAATRTSGADVAATVAAGRSNGGDLTSGEYVLVPWAYGPDCRPLDWSAGMPAPWSPPAGPAVYSGRLRPRDRWIRGRPTLDVYMAALQPLWTEGASPSGLPGATPSLTAREFFDFYLSLPTEREFDQRVTAALGRVDRWASAHASLASREPARAMLDSLRWLWTHGRAPVASSFDAQEVDRRAFDVVIGPPGTYSAYLQLEDDLPGRADRKARVAVHRLHEGLYLRVTPEAHARVTRGAFAYVFLLSRDPEGLAAIPATDQPSHGPSADVVRAMDFRNRDNTGPNAVGPKNVNAAGEFRHITYAGFVMEIRVLSFEIAGLGPSAVPAFTRLSGLVTVRDARGAQATAAVLPADRLLSFSSVRSTGGDDPHAYGIVIEIFKHDGMWTGFISEYAGPVADPPAARLDDLRVDERTGRIVFTAELTIGVTMPPGTTSWVPARSRYEFSGTVGPETVAGSLTRRPADHAAASPTREDVVLAREPPKGDDLTYDAWMAIWQARLRARGAAGLPGG